MGWSPYYPAGVTDEMIEQYFGDDGSCCANCSHYCDGYCSILEDKATKEELEQMEQADDFSPIMVDEDYCCDDYDYDDSYDEEPYEYEPDYEDWERD